MSSVLYIGSEDELHIFKSCGEMNTRQRAAYRLYWWGMAAYCVTLPIAVLLSRHFHPWRGRFLFMFLPLAAVGVILRSMMLYFAAADEMQRRILAEGCAYAFIITVFATVACGFFEGKGIPVIPWSVRFAFMMVVWGFAVSIVKARYK